MCWGECSFARITLSLLLVPTLLVGCHVREPRGTSELQVRWTVAGSSDRGQCAARDIDAFAISVQGPTVGMLTVPCDESWTALFDGLLPGRHAVHLRAIDPEGRVVASRSGQVPIEAFELRTIEIDLDHAAFEQPATGTTDLEVGWSIDGARDLDTCTRTGVARFAVNVAGPSSADDAVECGARWCSGEAFYGLQPGDYDVTVTAQDAEGQPLASRSSRVALAVDPTTIWTVDVDFDSAELAAGPTDSTGALRLRWNINGTVDGTGDGDSWDRCDEVGAETVRISVDGAAQTADCGGSDVGAMQTLVEGIATGPRQVTVELLDAEGDPLTTAASGELTVGGDSEARFVAEFFFDAFFEPVRSSIGGDYLFKLLLAGDGCQAVDAGELTMSLQREGQPVSPAPLVCEAKTGDDCFAADGQTPGSCPAAASSQRIGELSWGMYRLTVSARSAAGELCWQTRDPQQPDLTSVEILVGAGASNPMVTHDLAVLPACAP